MATNLWATLNDRQRAYLRALYDADQAKEAERRMSAARGFWDRTPASQWRWVMYGPVAPPSALHTALRSAGLVDPGTGATWQALEDRHLVQCRHTPDAFGVQLLEVQITTLGRKLVRTAVGEPPKPKAPKGQLRPRQWAALARLAAAGDEGINTEILQFGRNGFDWWNTLRRLAEYQPAPLIETQTRYPGGGHIAYDYHLTSAGRAYYAREWARYRELYPDVDAPKPAEEQTV